MRMLPIMNFRRLPRLKYTALVLAVFALGGSLMAQRLDTVRTDEPGYRSVVLTRDKKGEPKGPVSYYDEHHVLRRTLEFKNGKLHGKAVYYYPTGLVWAEMPYRNGELHGVIRSFHRNGAIEAMKPYRRGKMHGERVLRDSTGALVNGEYVEPLPYDSVQVIQTCVNGRPHGRVVVARSGMTVLEGNCENGRAEGVFIVYDRDGRAIRRDIYRKGRFVNSLAAQ